jgi:hypothetical protein
VFARFLLPLFVLVGFAPLYAQDEPIHMRPEFPLIFPVTQVGKIVTVKYPIMINPLTALKPGTQLRVIYNLSVDAQSSNDHIFAHKGSLSDAFARDPSASSGAPKSDLPPEMQHEIDGYHKTVWEVSGNFVMAMAQYPTDTMHLVFSPTAKNNDLHDERFSFFDGLMVGQPNGPPVIVIAVEKESKADNAGIKAGDEIVSVGGVSVGGDLNHFATAFSHAKKVAEENEAESYVMTVRSPSSPDARTVNLPMPPRLKGGLMDGFH